MNHQINFTTQMESNLKNLTTNVHAFVECSCGFAESRSFPLFEIQKDQNKLQQFLRSTAKSHTEDSNNKPIDEIDHRQPNFD